LTDTKQNKTNCHRIYKCICEGRTD